MYRLLSMLLIIFLNVRDHWRLCWLKQLEHLKILSKFQLLNLKNKFQLMRLLCQHYLKN